MDRMYYQQPNGQRKTALNAFNQAITAAEAVLNYAGATQAEVNQAVTRH